MPIVRSAKLSIRVPEAQRRRIKSVAASLGLSLQEVVEGALEAWVLKHDPQAGRSVAAKSAGVPRGTPQKPKRSGDQKLGRIAPRPAIARGRNTQAPQPEVAGWAWLKRAPSLDWSQCPAVELVTGKDGRVWVFRGTQIPLPAVLLSFIEGHSMEEIVEHYDGLNAEQVNTVLEFAAARLLVKSPG